MKVLLLTPLGKEFKFLKSSFAQLGFEISEKKIGKFTAGFIESLNLYFLPGGHGKCQFAIKSQYFIDRLGELDLMICAGAGGSISRNVSAGDIVVATSTIEHDYNLRFIKRSLPEFKGDSELLNKIKQIAVEIKDFDVHFARIASGDEDIIDGQRAKEIFNMTEAVAVAWEGVGGARAASFNQIDFIEIRGITDFADKSAKIDFDKNLRFAMQSIALLITKFLSR